MNQKSIRQIAKIYQNACGASIKLRKFWGRGELPGKLIVSENYLITFNKSYYQFELHENFESQKVIFPDMSPTNLQHMRR